MEDKNQETEKKEWSTPALEVFGDIQALTQTINKSFGFDDGYAVQGIPIGVS